MNSMMKSTLLIILCLIFAASSKKIKITDKAGDEVRVFK